MLDSSNPPSTPLLLLLLNVYVDIGSLPVVRIHAYPFPKFGTFVVLMGISNVVTVSSQINSYVACQ
jgi:hypothetical protein